MKPYCPHEPNARQQVFLQIAEEEALYGGAAGGGKSDALLMGALQYVHVPGYSAGLFRRTLKDLALPNAIKARLDNWLLGTNARWDEELNGYRFPTGVDKDGLPLADATIVFGYLSHPSHRLRYQGAEFQYVGVDELTQWDEADYLYLFSRLRKLVGSPVPLRMRAGTNPGGPGHEWVKARFVASGVDQEGGRYKRSPPSPEAIALAQELGETAVGAAFVPSFARDNPALDVASYRRQLLQLDPVTRRQLEQGDWDAVQSGEHFQADWFGYVDQPPPGLLWMRYWDLAGTEPHEANPDPDWTAGVKMAIERAADGTCRVFIGDAYRFRENPGGVERNVRTTAEADGKAVLVRIEQEPGSAGKNTIHTYGSRVLFGWDVAGLKKTGDKPSFWNPLAAAARNGLVYLVRGAWNRDFVAELCALPNGKKDQADAAGGAFALLQEDMDVANARALIAAMKGR